MLTIRPARVEDARAGAECHLACWCEAYADAGDGRDGDIDPDLEVYAINVRAFGYGTGVGAALLATAAEICLRR